MIEIRLDAEETLERMHDLIHQIKPAMRALLDVHEGNQDAANKEIEELTHSFLAICEDHNVAAVMLAIFSALMTVMENAGDHLKEMEHGQTN